MTKVTQGDSKQIELTIYEGDTDTPVDLSGRNLQWVLSPLSGTPALVTKTTGAGIVITDATAGEVLITLDPADTKNLMPGRYLHDTAILDNGAVTTVHSGILTIEAEAGGTGKPITGAEGTVLEGIDLSDPCAVWPKLQAAYYELLGGGAVVRTRFGSDDVTFAQANRGDLLAAINRLRDECEAKTTGRPRRRAFKAGFMR